MVFNTNIHTLKGTQNFLGIRSEFRFFYGKNIINFIYERKKFYQKNFQKDIWLGIEEQEKKIIIQYSRTLVTTVVYFVVMIVPRLQGPILR